MNADPTGIENARVIAMADAAAPATAPASADLAAARQRAEAAEARVKVLETALRDVQQASGMGTYAAGIELVQRVASAALASPPANETK